MTYHIYKSSVKSYNSLTRSDLISQVKGFHGNEIGNRYADDCRANS